VFVRVHHARRADWCDPELNPKLLGFACHYGVALESSKGQPRCGQVKFRL
jgi:hypothetical protein